MSAEPNLCAVVLLALLATVDANPLSPRKGLDNFEDQQRVFIVPQRESNIERIFRREEDIEGNDFATMESYSNDNYVTEARRAFSTSDFPSRTDTQMESYDYEDCGKVTKRFKRIIGGRSSRFGSHPWQAVLYESNRPNNPHCGGVLVSDRSVITAAHCVYGEKIKMYTIRLGEHNVREASEALPHEVYKIEEAKVHPDYSSSLKGNDLAILKLDRTVKFDWHIMPVCLPTRDLDLIGKKATVSGWGSRRTRAPETSPAILNEVEVEVFSNDLCNKWLTSEFLRVHLNDGQLCAGSKNGGKDACGGDSGGPLTISVDDRSVLIGVVSTGFGCGEKQKPGIYMNVWEYVSWIRRIINQQR